MQAIFDAYWNSPHTYPLEEIEATREAPQALREYFETLVADAVAPYPALPPGAADLLGYSPLSGDLAVGPR